jgi:hypothetical protein
MLTFAGLSPNSTVVVTVRVLFYISDAGFEPTTRFRTWKLNELKFKKRFWACRTTGSWFNAFVHSQKMGCQKIVNFTKSDLGFSSDKRHKCTTFCVWGHHNQYTRRFIFRGLVKFGFKYLFYANSNSYTVTHRIPNRGRYLECIFCQSRVIKRIFFCIKRSRLEVKKTSVGFRMVGHLVFVSNLVFTIRKLDFLSGFRMVGTSLDRFAMNKIFF